MKAILLGLLLTAGAICAADFAGRWDGTTDLKDRDGRTVPMHMRLTQEAGKISGGIWTEDHDEDQPRAIQNATLNGNHLRFEVPQKADAVVTFELDVDGDSMTGSAKFQGPNGAQELKLALKRAAAK
jgi:hypothetical protein